MYNADTRTQVIQRLHPVLGPEEIVKDSRLLQAFSTLYEIHNTGMSSSWAAYQRVKSQYPSCRNGTVARGFNSVPEEEITQIYSYLSQFSYPDFLTYVVPEIACNARSTGNLLRKDHHGYEKEDDFYA